jgi:hypothetical protein
MVASRRVLGNTGRCHCGSRGYVSLMSDEHLIELETQLTSARASIAELTKTNAELTGALESANLALRRSRRHARHDGNVLRDQISHLQNRRG